MTDERVPDVKSTRFRMTDYALIAMMIVPILACIVLKVLFTPASEGVNIAGALVYVEFPAPVMPLPKLIFLITAASAYQGAASAEA